MVTQSVKTEIVNVDATLATLYLEENTINRTVNHHRVNAYAAQMEAGQWRLNGEPIIISNTEKLLDGQHRLLAVKENNLKIPMLFVFGINEDSFDTINTGDSRTGADVLSISGLNKTQAMTLAVCVRHDLYMQLAGSISVGVRINRQITPHIILNAVKKNAKYMEAVNFVLEHRTGNLPVSIGMLSFLLYRFWIVSDDFEQTSEWILGLMTGANLDSNDPRLWINNKIWREFSRQAKTNKRQRCGYIIKAWNLYRTGRVIKNESNLYVNPLDAYKYIAMTGDRSRKR